jgi:class 3 adenylate cyclase
MSSCPACARPLADDFAFCPGCGSPLGALPAAADERRTVTAVFCDLVGFTAMTEAADPEDVDACVRAYGARARDVIERHGGVVEKFIGDAVMGLFGVPLAHEDDAERAVRAALRLVHAAGEIGGPDGSSLQARAGVNTGLVLVRGGAVAASGQGVVTGDAVNLAARLQAAAPPGAVVAGALTHELTRRVVRYEPLAPFAVKGKAEPVEAWLALAPVSRTGADEADGGHLDTPFVGRDVELAALEHEFDEALRTSQTQVALITGDAGMGKSRLVAELARRLDRRPELVTWRQGRCLPYEEGAAFGAFAEVVKSHAGILDTDGVETRRGKVDAAVPAVQDREWLLERLGALAGVPAPDSTAEASAAASARFVAALAGIRPLVLVLEDVHRADDGFLSFVEELARVGVGDGALLLVLTARPGLLDRWPGFLSPAAADDGAPPAATLRVALSPLAQAEVQSIVAAIGGYGAGEGLAERVVQVAGGNPLYAEEATRLLAGGRAEIEPPASLAAVYTARLDGLPAAQRDVLSDAAVIGVTFWDGALCSPGRRSRRATLEELDALEVAGLVRAERASTVAGERQFTFVHTIAREVAYERLTRDTRARRHAAVADWLEAKAAGDETAFADELARHRSSAFALAEAAGDVSFASELRRPAVRSLRAAGQRARAIDAAEAERWYGRAVELVEADDGVRPALLGEWGRVLLERGRGDDAADAVRAAIEGFIRSSQPEAAAFWSDLLAGVLVNLEDPGWFQAQEDAMRLVEDVGPCAEKADVLLASAMWRLNPGNDRVRAWEIAGEYAAMVEELDLDRSGLDWLQAELQWRAGDRTGLETLRRMESAQPSNDGGIAFCHASLAFDGPAAAIEVADEHIMYFERRAVPFCSEAFRSMLAAFQLWAGEWETALATADAAASGLPDTSFMDRANARLVRLLYEVWSGTRPTDGLVAEVAARAAASPIADTGFWCSVACAAAATAAGRVDEARAAIRTAAVRADGDPEYIFLVFPEAVRLALVLGETAAAHELAAYPETDLPVAVHVRTTAAALLAEADGRTDEAAAGFADAAARWHDFGVPYEEAHALLGLGRCLATLVREADAATTLADAARTFTRLGATPALREAERLLDVQAGRGAGS